MASGPIAMFDTAELKSARNLSLAPVRIAISGRLRNFAASQIFAMDDEMLQPDQSARNPRGDGRRIFFRLVALAALGFLTYALIHWAAPHLRSRSPAGLGWVIAPKTSTQAVVIWPRSFT
jgi:hypothetical protein